MGMLELGEDLLPEAVATEDGLPLQHWSTEELEALLLL